MSITIHTMKKPLIYATEEVGTGLIPAGTYYYIAVLMSGGSRNMNYYGASLSVPSEEISITVSANAKIKLEWWTDGGDISSFADAGGGVVTVTTSVAHGRANTDTVSIRGTTNYDADYTISNVTATTFDITATWVATETGQWFADAGHEAQLKTWFGTGYNKNHCMFKWDNYTMINPSNSKPYQWLNVNDPAFSGEWTSTRGHNKWCDWGLYSNNGNVSSITLEEIKTSRTGTSYTDTKYMYNNTANNDSYITAYYRNVPSVAMRVFTDDAETTVYDNWEHSFSYWDGAVLVYIDISATTHTTIDFLNAIDSLSSTYLFQSSVRAGTGARTHKQVHLLGHLYILNSSNTYSMTFSDIDLTLYVGILRTPYYGSTTGSLTNERVKIQRGTIYYMGCSKNYWISQTGKSFTDSKAIAYKSCAYILDYSNFSNTSVVGNITFYSKQPSGLNMIGGTNNTTAYFQWRYQRRYNSPETSISKMSDMYIKDYFVYLVEDGTGSVTGYMTDVDFVNDGLQNYDVLFAWNYTDGDCNKIMECTNVTSDRADGKVKLYYSSASSYTWSDTWNMRFGINLTVIDEDGNVVDGVSVNLDWGAGSVSDTTDLNGEAIVKGLSYVATHDSTNPTATYYTNSAYNTMTLTISKAGYGTYKLKDIELREGKTFTLTLPSSGTETRIYDSTFYNSTIY